MARPDYELSLCKEACYGMSGKMQIIICTKDGEHCPFQRYCPSFLKGVHTSGVLGCNRK